MDAVGLLTGYIVLLFAVPSSVTLSALGSLGRPALLWGLVLLLVWVLTRLQMRAIVFQPLRQPIRVALGALIVIALVSFAAAILRGQPADQVSPAITGLIRIASWAGVVLVAIDGLRTRNEVSTVLRRLVIAATCVAILGLAQFASGSDLIGWVQTLPGLKSETSGIVARGAFTRATGTAIHPLEFIATIAAILPIAVVTAVAHGYVVNARRKLIWWLSPGLILVVSLLAVSRSAIIGIAVAVIASIPGLPRAYRWTVGLGAVAAMAAVIVAVPGIFGTIVTLFAGASDDPSTQSRTNALERVPEFVSASPWIGEGFGLFMSRYYIFDNQWVVTVIEFGILGALAMIGLVSAAVWSAAHAARVSQSEDTRAMGQAVAAAMLTIAILFTFFDALSFPIAAGTFFLIAGLAGAMRTVGEVERTQAAAGVRLAALTPDDPF